MTVLERRKFLILLAGSVLSSGLVLPACADPGGGNSGNGGGNGNGGGGNSGNGSHGGDRGNSGHGKSGSDDGKGNSGDEGDEGKDVDDQKTARTAVKNGKAASLREILTAVRRRYKGEIVDVDLSRRGAQYTYRIKLLAQDGRLFSLTVDAASKKILNVSGL
jgi:hypothetical protein